MGVWDLRSLLQICLIKAPGVSDELFRTAEFSPYGNRIMTADPKGASVWDAETGESLLRLNVPQAMQAFYTRDGLRIVTASRQYEVGVWDAETGRSLRTIHSPKRVLRILLGPDGKRCLVEWGLGLEYLHPLQGASLFDLDSGAELVRLNEGADGLVGFSADGKTFFSFDGAGGYKGTVWSAKRARSCAPWIWAASLSASRLTAGIALAWGEKEGHTFENGIA